MTTLLRIKPSARYTTLVEKRKKVQEARLTYYFSICNSARDIALGRLGSERGRKRRCIVRLMTLYSLLQKERKVRVSNLIARRLSEKMYIEWTTKA
jgi:hypothetical protein